MAEQSMATQLGTITQHSKDKTGEADNFTAARDPALAVLGLPELLESILAYLPTRELTRNLRVSKQWQKVVLSSRKLRRNLFLEPVESSEYLTWDGDHSSQCSVKVHRERKPVIVHESGRYRLPIVEPHPVFMREISSGFEYYGSSAIKFPPIQKLETLSQSTLLTQPPAEFVEIYSDHCDDVGIHVVEGGTFGPLIERVKKINEQDGGAIKRYKLGIGKLRKGYDDDNDDCESYFQFESPRIVFSDNPAVKTARMSLASTQLGASRSIRHVNEVVQDTTTKDLNG